jgi:hypothetical protein
MVRRAGIPSLHSESGVEKRRLYEFKNVFLFTIVVGCPYLNIWGHPDPEKG